MKEYDTEEKILEYFKKINCTSKDNICFSGSTLTQTFFGAIGVLISVKKNKNVMGYLLNKIETGICLIPIIAVTLTKNEIQPDKHVFIKNEDIEKVVIKNEGIGFKLIKIILKDKTKYTIKVSQKIKKVDYQERNLNKFIEIYK